MDQSPPDENDAGAPPPSADAEALNRALIDDLVKSGRLTSPRIEKAFRAVYRHHFLPDLPLPSVYRDEAIMTRVEENVPLSSSSQPSMMAIMLEQLELQPGDRVLEIGTATGYNAALMGYLVGPAGRVISIDIDGELVDEARVNLRRAGTTNVEALAADGGYGYPDAAPYDAIILTVGSWDIAPAWHEQLADDGRLLLPLSLFGDYQESILFEREGNHLVSSSHYCCSFVRLRGAFAGPEGRTVELEPDLKLLLEHDDDRVFDPSAVRTLLDSPSHDLRSGISIRPREIYFRLLRALWSRLDNRCGIIAEGELADSGIVPFLFGAPGKQSYSTGLIDGKGLALLSGAMIEPGGKPSDDPFEIVVRCYGQGNHLGERLLEEITRWDRSGRPCEDESMTIRAYPSEQPYTPAAGERVIEKEWSRLVLSWEI